MTVERIARLHASLVFTTLALALLMAAVLMYAGWRSHGEPERLGNAARSGLWIVQLLVVAECVLGGLLWYAGVRPARSEVHLIYAVVACLTLPGVMLYSRNSPHRRFVQAAGCLFLCAILLRALSTGRGPA